MIPATPPPADTAPPSSFTCRNTSAAPSARQLIEYTLEPNPDAADDKDVPPQRLALVFSTADVEMLGWRLGHLADQLQENSLAAVRVLPKRYAEAVGHSAFVASITVTPIAKAAAGKG